MTSARRKFGCASLLALIACGGDGGQVDGQGGEGGAAGGGARAGAAGRGAGMGGASGGSTGGAGTDGVPANQDAAAAPDAATSLDAAVDRAPSADASVTPRTICPTGPFPEPMLGTAQPVCVGVDYNYSFHEGPTWVASAGAFFFTNFLQGQPMRGDIVKYTPGRGCEIFVRDVGCNGLAASPDGGLLAACHQSRSVIRFDPVTKQQQTLASMHMGQMLDTPNDLVAHTNGSIYFTNPTYELGGRPPGVGMAVFRIDPAGALHVVMRGGRPNGIALAPDQRTLYVIGAGIWQLDGAGVPGTRREMFTGGDGLATDCGGNVYSSNGGLWSAQGQRIGNIPAGTNLAFGGADGKTLLIVGGGTTVRAIPMNLPGLP